MNKVWLYSYWVMAGRWRGEKPKLVTSAWLTSTLPPFYRGTGVAFRIGPWSLKIGVCYPRMPVTVDEYTYVDDLHENLAAVGGYELEQDNKEIRRWSTSSEASHANPESPGTEPSSGASSPE